MNGEMYQACCIVAAAKKALRTKTSASYTKLNYENKIEFQFLPEKKLFGTKTHRVEGVANWYDYCHKKGLQDIKYHAPIAVQDRSLLGFSNTTHGSLVCLYKGRVTYFAARWEADRDAKVWNILYTEHEWTNAPAERPYFVNNAESFQAVLINIKELASKIEADYFAGVFQRTLDILSGSSDHVEPEFKMPLPDIPEENLRLFKAASTADVFGAMGSWNDSPAYLAHQKGLHDEYESLSSELLSQVRLAALYAINEW